MIRWTGTAKNVWPAWVWLCSTIQFQLLKYPINRKDWIQMVSKRFDDKTAPKRTSETSVRNWTTAKSAKCRIKFKCTISFCSYIYSYLSYRFDGYWGWLLRSQCRLPTCSKSFAHWTGTGRLTRQGWASPRRPWLAQPIKHKRCQQTHERIHCLPLTQKTATERNSLKFTKFSLRLKALSQSCMNLQPGSVEAALFVAALVPP